MLPAPSRNAVEALGDERPQALHVGQLHCEMHGPVDQQVHREVSSLRRVQTAVASVPPVRKPIHTALFAAVVSGVAAIDRWWRRARVGGGRPRNQMDVLKPAAEREERARERPGGGNSSPLRRVAAPIHGRPL